MQKTNVYLLVPEYAGMSGAIQAAYDLATNVDPDGPIQFHLVDYPEANPKHFLIKNEEWEGMDDITPSAAFSKESIDIKYSISEEHFKEQRKYLDEPESLIDRMSDAEDWFFETMQQDPANSLVILLNPYGNTHNYFCGPSPFRKNVAFIQTTHYATETLTARHIPIAYEFFASALRFRAFNEPDYQEKFVHFKDKGCVNDFFKEIKDIRLKILSADICDTCYAHIEEQGVDLHFMKHLHAGLEQVRDQQNNFKRALRSFRTTPIRLGQRYLYFDEFGSQVLLSPKEMTLYKFFCSKPEGVHYADIREHEEELKSIYRQHYSGELDEMNATIDGVVGRWCGWDSDISQTVSKINKKIKDGITPKLAKPHLIEGKRNKPKRIAYVG